jgi:hypothetical protein
MVLFPSPMSHHGGWSGAGSAESPWQDQGRIDVNEPKPRGFCALVSEQGQ